MPTADRDCSGSNTVSGTTIDWRFISSLMKGRCGVGSMPDPVAPNKQSLARDQMDGLELQAALQHTAWPCFAYWAFKRAMNV